MAKSLVALTRYERPEESVRAAVELCSGLDHLSSTDRVFIKPNIVFFALGAIPQVGSDYHITRD